MLIELAELAERMPFDIKTTAAPHFRRVLLEHKVRRNEIKASPTKSGARRAA